MDDYEAWLHTFEAVVHMDTPENHFGEGNYEDVFR